jgi:hypothetical protein
MYKWWGREREGERERSCVTLNIQQVAHNQYHGNSRSRQPLSDALSLENCIENQLIAFPVNKMLTHINLYMYSIGVSWFAPLSSSPCTATYIYIHVYTGIVSVYVHLISFYVCIIEGDKLPLSLSTYIYREREKRKGRLQCCSSPEYGLMFSEGAPAIFVETDEGLFCEGVSQPGPLDQGVCVYIYTYKYICIGRISLYIYRERERWARKHANTYVFAKHRLPPAGSRFFLAFEELSAVENTQTHVSSQNIGFQNTQKHSLSTAKWYRQHAKTSVFAKPRLRKQ